MDKDIIIVSIFSLLAFMIGLFYFANESQRIEAEATAHTQELIAGKCGGARE